MSEDIQPSHQSVIQPGISDQTREICLSCPTQQITFLGALLNTISMTIALPEEKMELIVQTSHQMYSTHQCSLQELSTLLGCMSHAAQTGIWTAPLHYRMLQMIHRRNLVLGFQVEEAHSSATRFHLERPRMMDSTRTCSVQSTSNSITSLRPVNQNRCLSDRVGSYLQQSVHRRSLGPTGSKTACQCIGIEGCLPGPAVIPQPDTSPSSAYPSRDG